MALLISDLLLAKVTLYSEREDSCSSYKGRGVFLWLPTGGVHLSSIYRLGKCSVLITENITPLEECTKATRPPIDGEGTGNEAPLQRTPPHICTSAIGKQHW